MKAKTPVLKPKIVLCVAAHPDDLESWVAGSVAKWTAGGAEVHYLICTDGGKGSDDRAISSKQLTEMRRQEQRDAAEALGIKSVQFLDYEDCFTETCLALKRDITRVIRQVKPDTVVTLDPAFVYNIEYGIINHSDHRNVGLATIDAVYPLARDYLSFPELITEGLEPHNTHDLLLTMVFENANYFVDISTTYETKLDAMAAHESQFQAQIADGWLDSVEQMAHDMGVRDSCKYAEGYIRINIDAK